MSSFGAPKRTGSSALQVSAEGRFGASSRPPRGASPRWQQAKKATGGAGAVGAWTKAAEASQGAGGAGALPSPPPLSIDMSPAGKAFQSRLTEAQTIVLALREETQRLQVQLDDSRGEAADATLRLELVLAEATRRGVDLRSWLLVQVGDGSTPLPREPSLSPVAPPDAASSFAALALKKRDQSHHTTPGWGMLRAEAAVNPRPVGMADIVKVAFPTEREVVGKFTSHRTLPSLVIFVPSFDRLLVILEKQRVEDMSRAVRRRAEDKANPLSARAGGGKPAIEKLAKQKKAEAIKKQQDEKRKQLAKAAKIRQRTAADKEVERKAAMARKVAAAADRQKAVRGASWSAAEAKAVQLRKERKKADMLREAEIAAAASGESVEAVLAKKKAREKAFAQRVKTIESEHTRNDGPSSGMHLQKMQMPHCLMGMF